VFELRTGGYGHQTTRLHCAVQVYNNATSILSPAHCAWVQGSSFGIKITVAGQTSSEVFTKLGLHSDESPGCHVKGSRDPTRLVPHVQVAHAKGKVEVTLRPRSVGQSVLVSGTHLGPVTYSSPSFFLSFFFYFNYCIFTIYSRYMKRVTSKRDGCEYLKQVPSSNSSLELI
jgi:hypothetical protein